MTLEERNEAMDRLDYLGTQISELYVDSWVADECGDERSVRRAGARIFRLEAERGHLLLKFPEIKYAKEPTS